MLDLHRQLAAFGIPIDGVAKDRIDYEATATPEQRQQGDAILKAFDWDAEPVPVAEWVYMFQLRKAMRRTLIVPDQAQYGSTLSALEAYVEAAGDPDLEDEFDASTVRRDHATVEWIRVLFNWEPAQVDALFRLAASL